MKSTSIDSLPKILIIDFVRYNLGKKNQDIISYSSELSLQKYTSHSIDKVNSIKMNGKPEVSKS